MPLGIEDAVVLWFNKLNSSNTINYLRKTDLPKDLVSSKIRIHKDQIVEAKIFPPVKSISDCLRDGRSLLSVVLHYFPKATRIEGKILQLNIFFSKVN